MIATLEDFKPGVYYDGNGNATFGIGTMLKSNEVDKYIKEYGTYDIEKKTYYPPPGKDLATTKAVRLVNATVKDVTYYMNENIKVPLSQEQVNAITSYLYYKGSNPKPRIQEDSALPFYQAINNRDIEGMVNFMLTKKSQSEMRAGNWKRAYNTARFILGEISLDALLTSYDTSYSDMFPDIKK